ncbi:MAG: hypothetical protein U0R52_05135 [Solirubrobacterales bacterium]
MSAQAPAEPRSALRALAAQLRGEETVISAHIVEPAAEPLLGVLCAAGPRAAPAPGSYAMVIEAVREGHLLHRGEPRLLEAADPDLRLLAGDYLYALGIERLAALGDTAAVTELGDLISLAAMVAAEARPGLSPGLWLGAAVAVGCGSDREHREAKEAARRLEPGAGRRLVEAAARRASANGLGEEFGRAAEGIDSRLPNLADG